MLLKLRPILVVRLVVYLSCLSDSFTDNVTHVLCVDITYFYVAVATASKLLFPVMCWS